MPSKINRLRNRDGDGCWLCGGMLDFGAEPNSKKAPTKEHLQPLSAGGTDALDNLVLCHPGCNRQLGDRAREDKEKMRARRIAKAAVSAAPGSATSSPPAKPKSVTPTTSSAARASPMDWRSVACIAIATATFFAGLSLGLVLG
jgi:hypothetical protein